MHLWISWSQQRTMFCCCIFIGMLILELIVGMMHYNLFTNYIFVMQFSPLVQGATNLILQCIGFELTQPFYDIVSAILNYIQRATTKSVSQFLMHLAHATYVSDFHIVTGSPATQKGWLPSEALPLSMFLLFFWSHILETPWRCSEIHVNNLNKQICFTGQV
ncbi:hypothetical protein ACJX0J_008570, partial [Zea mays]